MLNTKMNKTPWTLYTLPLRITKDIFIYKGNIKEATSILEQIKANFFNINFNDIVLAHEIFHYINITTKAYIPTLDK